MMNLTRMLSRIKGDYSRKAMQREIGEELNKLCPEYEEEIYKCPRCVRQLRDKLLSGTFIKA